MSVRFTLTTTPYASYFYFTISSITLVRNRRAVDEPNRLNLNTPVDEANCESTISVTDDAIICGHCTPSFSIDNQEGNIVDPLPSQSHLTKQLQLPSLTTSTLPQPQLSSTSPKLFSPLPLQSPRNRSSDR
ncbi:hypothetical protein Bhyg_09949, partial [Pseudolycoriella hygida]